MQNAEAIAVRTRNATLRRFTPSRLIRLVPFHKDLLDDECNGDLDEAAGAAVVQSWALEWTTAENRAILRPSWIAKMLHSDRFFSVIWRPRFPWFSLFR
jgi:hypothetical protein